ncbi:MAG: adenosine deaminase [Elusimicrobia bacterium]|nr:adenosine deaminase [Elusimicrobiota bacterium]
MPLDKKTEDRIKGMRKAELHRHLEGCVRVPTVIDIAKKHKLKLPTFDEMELEKIYKLRKPMNSLSEVLKMFEIAQASFASYEAIERITYEALEHAYDKENISLLELRFSPDFMLKGKDLDWEKSLDVIGSTIKKFENNHSFFCGIIIIASRSFGMNSVLKTIDFAVKNKNLIVGFDFADDEKNYPSALYKNAVKKLHQAGIPLTVHSGEEGHFSQVIETIQELGPRRIGHGVKIADDRTGKTAELVKSSGVTIETNPWSNYLTHAVESIETHPLKNFINSGLKVSISADDPEILDTNLNKEYLLAVEKTGLSFDDLLYTLRCALDASFLPPDKKQQAARQIETQIHFSKI